MSTLPRMALTIAMVFCSILRPTHCSSEGAFAYGQFGNGGWASGVAYNYSTQAEAENAAMNSCNARGYNCSIRLTFRNTCFAYAIQDGNSGAAWNTDSNLNSAQGVALGQCVRMGFPCTVKESICDNVSEEAVRAAQQDAWNQFLYRWQECFAVVQNDAQSHISACDQALSYATDSGDRFRLIQQRDFLVQQQRVAYEEFLHRWQECFAVVQNDAQSHISACDRALSYATDSGDRSRLIQQRDFLISLQTQPPPQNSNGEQSAIKPTNSVSPEAWLQAEIYDAMSHLAVSVSRFASNEEAVTKVIYLLLGVLLGGIVYALFAVNHGQNGVLRSRASQTSYGGILSRADRLEKLLELIGNGPTFAVLYIIFMIPTYTLPYYGSNSKILTQITGGAAGMGSPPFWVHLGCLGALCLLALARGAYVGKGWLIIFPIFASLFDMVPTLNFVPFVPTVMHLCAVIIGVSSRRE